jgi:thiamine-monophosphate kinase
VPGEASFLDWVRARCPRAGDDLAVLEPRAGRLLVGLDPVLDGVHLRVAEHGPTAAGRKAVNRNLSDLAAMGGKPSAVLLGLVVPKGESLDRAKAAFLGAEQAARDAGCEVVGGDFATWNGPWCITAVILGHSDRPVPRTGVTPGQTLFVTGPLGGSILGRHLAFTPRLEAGLAVVGRVSAMMDLSDGLSRDLPRLLDGIGATLLDIPVHDDAHRLAQRTGRHPLWHALHDGEDYELLFAADTKPAAVACHPIGRVGGAGIVVEHDGGRFDLEPEGWEHELA